MVEDGRDCTEILVQIAAVKAELTNTSKEILKQHIKNTVSDEPRVEDIKKVSETIEKLF